MYIWLVFLRHLSGLFVNIMFRFSLLKKYLFIITMETQKVMFLSLLAFPCKQTQFSSFSLNLFVNILLLRNKIKTLFTVVGGVGLSVRFELKLIIKMSISEEQQRTDFEAICWHNLRVESTQKTETFDGSIRLFSNFRACIVCCASFLPIDIKEKMLTWIRLRRLPERGVSLSVKIIIKINGIQFRRPSPVRASTQPKF